MAKEEKVYQKRCSSLKNQISKDNLEQVKKAMFYEVDILDALKIKGSTITSIRMLKFLYEQLKAKAQEEDQGPSAAPILDAPPAKAAIAEDVVRFLLSKSTLFSDAINEINKPQDPEAAAVEPQTLQQAHEFITFAHEICPQFDILENYHQFDIRGDDVETLPVFRFLMSNEYSSDSALRLLERRQSVLSKAIRQNDTEAIAEIAKYAPSKVKNVLKNEPNLLYDNINTPSTLQFLIDKKLVSSPNFNSRGIAKASFVDAIDANEPFTLKDAPQNIQICNLDMLKFYLSKELNINIAIARYTRLESLIKANDVAGVKAFVGLVIPKANPQMAIESLQKKIFNIKNLDIKTIGMMQIFLDAGFKPDAPYPLIPQFDTSLSPSQRKIIWKKLINCTLTPEVAEFLLTKGATIDKKVLDYSKGYNQLLSFMLKNANATLEAEYAEQVLQESIQDLSSQGQATEDGAAAAAPRIVDPHHVLLPGMDLWSSGMAPAQELLGLDLRDVE